MAFIRKNVWALGGDFNDPTILWYARGVKAMQARPLSDPTAWRFFGAIHGIDQPLWRELGYLSPQDHMPSQQDIRTYWNQCQHGSWYFLPWHRGYLLALEAVIRDAVIAAGGPSDWALPYWNYFKPNQNKLPPAFASKNWPDGQGDNPLFVPQRYGPDNDGNVFVAMDQVNEDELGDPIFTGTDDGGSPGFGGVDTGFSHGGNVHGGIESQPHDVVHGLVGGENLDTRLPGLMSDPDTAGLDPIFYLHHANIDRLWEVWNEIPASTGDPTASKWVDGPASVGQHAFVLPMPGGKSWTYTPGQMQSLSALGYSYDDVSSPLAQPLVVSRMQRLGASVAAANVRSTAMAGPSELIGASGSLKLAGTEARTAVALDQAVQGKVTSSLRAASAATTAMPSVPDRVFLNLENVRGLRDATTFNVYINVPDGDDPASHPELKAGSVALFGMRKASVADGTHAGDGLTFVLEISKIIDELHLAGNLGADQLHVRLVPRQPVPDEAQITIGRISVFRQAP